MPPQPHLLFTRPTGRGAAALRLLQQQVAVTVLPLFEITHDEISPTAQQQLAQLTTYAVLIAVSPSAAEIGLQALSAPMLMALQQGKLAVVAVGQQTAYVFAQAGIAAISPAVENSEGVLALDVIQTLTAQQQVMVWRGHGGRRLIQHSLFKQHIVLHEIAWYHRQLPAQAHAQWLQCHAHISHVLLSSTEAWDNFKKIAGQHAFRYHMLCLGERCYHRVLADMQQHNHQPPNATRLASLNAHDILCAITGQEAL